ncbi:hypothetical protein BWI93_01140 [Siphonobacter sp. BAB-5385]|uniref:hypothetical protein n=1 Tax=Siphonobacter sp. BAB-5385 TaxID=1864822 RepID=UPI000B9E6213|nr:hypothetical protein [Siphonobacter sp. BAB-5385]OZI09975.1 hypothetical protein BWI93_01140 [Siphonobacter sp. BAB-5385]
MKTDSVNDGIAEVETVETETGLAPVNNGLGISIPAIDLLGGEVPDLGGHTALPFDLSSEYWTPEKEGETKRVVFLKQEVDYVPDQQNPGNVLPLPCVHFIEPTADGAKQVRNGSKRLVAALENAINNGLVKQGTPLEIKYLGKRRNKTNSNLSDIWSIKPLIVHI